MPPLRVRRLCVALLIGALAACAMATPASAATKPYRVVVAPSSVPGGQQVFTATFTNLTAPQELGSADLTLPTGFTAISASITGPGMATLLGNVVQLRDLALQPNDSLNVKVTADVPCTPGTYAWSVIAKQSNDFSGLPGNDFGPLTPDSSLTTSVTGCGVRVVCLENANCTATLSNDNATFDVTAQSGPQLDGGVLIVNRNVGLDCAGYTELSKGDFAVDFLPNPGVLGREKVATLTIDKKTMNELPSNGAALLNMCFGAPFTFSVKPGTPPLQQPEPGLFVGLLPDCGAFPPPCVSKRNKTRAGQGVIEARAPGGDKDPRYGG
jgi:hypothetical protein